MWPSFREEKPAMSNTWNLKMTVSAAALILCSTPSLAHSPDTMLEELNAADLGKVSFATSCNLDAQPVFEIGLLLLHHMMYGQSAHAFEAAAEADPDCAMAQWGIAMTNFHPLWPGGPTPEETQAGQAAVARLADLDPGTPREAAYIEAVGAFYAGADKTFRERLAAWAGKQREIDEAFPDDLDAAAFDALAQLTMAPRGPDAVPELSDAGARMDALREQAPLHPAGYHYAIHAYDHPALAERALATARGYDRIAPEVPHALHMPSHIFTRLGRWEEAAAWNARSAAAVLAQSEGGIIADHYPHAIDYAVYAHLQAGDTAAAEALLAEVQTQSSLQNTFGSAYAGAATVARLPLEQDDWSGAAALTADLNPAISWERYPQAVAIRWHAKGLGAARSGDTAAAEVALEHLAELRAVMETRELGYWLALLDAQTKTIEAWAALSQGDEDTAIALMRAAADIEDKAGKAPVTPGHVLPARELLGDMLLETGDKAGAADAYQESLGTSPNRRRSLVGLARSSGG
jgi:tetratricopeptide (TPR) repeat protein